MVSNPPCFLLSLSMQNPLSMMCLFVTAYG